MGCAVIWDYMVDMNDEQLDNIRKQRTEYSRDWRFAHPERAKDITRKAAHVFYYKNRDDEEYMKERRETAREWHKRKMTESTPEELEEYRRKNREKQKRFQARQKAKKEQET